MSPESRGLQSKGELWEVDLSDASSTAVVDEPCMVDAGLELLLCVTKELTKALLAV